MSENPIGLIDGERCLELLFPGQDGKPTRSMRWFLKLKAEGLIPYRKIRGSVFYDPAEVRRAIDRLCRVDASQ
jgi:hypothetical protein